MWQALLKILAPGEKLPAGAVDQASVSAAGLGWAWALLLFLFLAAAAIWSYRRFAPGLPPARRRVLTGLRIFLFALLLLLVVRPVVELTAEESMRRSLLVLLDVSRSMNLVDRRVTAPDRARAAIATGAVNPDAGLDAPSAAAPELSRRQLLDAIARNDRLDFWPRLAARVDLPFFRFGRRLDPMGDLAGAPGGKLPLADAAAFFRNIAYDENQTALGDALRELLDKQRGQPVAGVFLITDGASNSGAAPAEAAALARQDRVPLFIYGVGVTSPRDILVTEVSAPPIYYVKEKMSVTVRFSGKNLPGRKAMLVLKANGQKIDERPVEFRSDDEQEAVFTYQPKETGDVRLEASIAPISEEVSKENNAAATAVRVVDDKIKVLLVEQAPTWNFRYLLGALQRDRRVQLKAVLLQGDPGLSAEPDSVYLDAIPDTKEALFRNDVILLGDVSPQQLGEARMKLLPEWVSEAGGGLVFLAGPRFDPSAYRGTPLETLLPVEISGDNRPDRYAEPVPLELTAAGELSPILTLSPDPAENTARWAHFPGVRWTARVSRARPGAQVLLADPTPDRATREGPMPVIATQSYGRGQTLFVGTDEFYRWRSRQGERDYGRIVGQMLQTLSAPRTTGGSARIQLKSDRPRYLTNDRVTISGRIFKAGFETATETTIPGTLTVQPETNGGPPAPEQTSDLSLQAVAERPGEYRAEFVARTPGKYRYATKAEPGTVLRFDVIEPSVELADTAMNEKLLREMAGATGGKFVREEDLHSLPDFIASRAAPKLVFKKVDLGGSPWLLGLILLVAFVEWALRRIFELK